MVSITGEAMAKEAHKKGGERMKTCLFGGLDGIITTFAVVAGAGGGGLSVGVVLIMGFSSLVADALSMGVGDALSSKAETEVAEKEMQREAWELENYPEGEIKEMVEIYEGRGFEHEDARLIVTTMAKCTTSAHTPRASNLSPRCRCLFLSLLMLLHFDPPCIGGRPKAIRGERLHRNSPGLSELAALC